jgi:hypothetical protein
MDSCITNSIHKETKYFQTLTKMTSNILTITGGDAQIVGSRRATITLPMGTQVTIENALLYLDSTCTLLSYRDIHKNELRVITHDILDRIPSIPSGLYYTYIKPVPHVTYKVIF